MKEERRTIVAVDFDGTIVEHEFPSIGEEKADAIRVLKRLQKHNVKLILWTCRDGERLEEAKAWLEKHGLIFDAYNENIPDFPTDFAQSKIYADLYIDDRNIIPLTEWLVIEEQFFPPEDVVGDPYQNLNSSLN